ncbi:hypothetical protein G6F56_009563 [Rhizopus delemar]|nr:hypothetical protein G6F56_009563 [Rhizopus delemar]
MNKAKDNKGFAPITPPMEKVQSPSTIDLYKELADLANEPSFGLHTHNDTFMDFEISEFLNHDTLPSDSNLFPVLQQK